MYKTIILGGTMKIRGILASAILALGTTSVVSAKQHNYNPVFRDAVGTLLVAQGLSFATTECVLLESGTIFTEQQLLKIVTATDRGTREVNIFGMIVQYCLQKTFEKNSTRTLDGQII
jgi:hypothetical protein